MYSVFSFLAHLLDLVTVLLVIRIIMSWVAPRANWYNQPFKSLYLVTEPMMAPFRAIVPPIGGIDFSPMLLFILLSLLRNFFAGLA